jgi:hypothetical protein
VWAGAGYGGGRGGRAFAQGANMCVYVPLQDTTWGGTQRSALHYASSSGLESIVAKLLSLGANAALVDKVRALHTRTRARSHSCMHTEKMHIYRPDEQERAQT